MRLCSGPGCGRAVPEDVRFCDECKAERGSPVASDGIREHSTAYDADLDAQRKSTRWQRVRLSVLKKFFLCARCQRAVSEICDHIVPAAVAVMQAQESKRYLDKWAGYYLKSNLQGLCRSCHGLKTLEDKAHVGPWPNVVETEDKAPKKVWTF